MDLTELIAQFRTFTKDKSEPYLWEDEDITLWFNEAEREAALRARLLFDKTSDFCEISVVSGTSVYALSKFIHEIEYAYLVDSNDKNWVMRSTDRMALDDNDIYWRENTDVPDKFIQDDTQIELNAIIAASYTLTMEVYRAPLINIEDSRYDEPEIALAHHEHLVKWVMHRAYLINDSDAYAAKLSKQYLKEFEDYFGLRPKAGLRKKEQIDRPQSNKVWI